MRLNPSFASTSFPTLLALVVTLALGFSLKASAGSLDDSSQQALQQTQNLLNDPKQIEAYARENKGAAQANDNIKALMGNNAADTAAVYKLSADIFGDLTKQSGGDPEAMQKILSEAMRNPAEFTNRLSPEQRKSLSDLAGKAEAHKPSAARP